MEYSSGLASCHLYKPRVSIQDGRSLSQGSTSCLAELTGHLCRVVSVDQMSIIILCCCLWGVSLVKGNIEVVRPIIRIVSLMMAVYFRSKCGMPAKERYL